MTNKEWRQMHGRYERRAFRTIRKGFRRIAKNIPKNGMTRGNFKEVINLGVDQGEINSVLFKVWRDIGFIHGQRIIKDIQSELPKNLPLFNQSYQDILTNYILTRGGSKWRLIRGAFAEYLIEFIADLVDQGLSFQEIIFLMDKETSSRGFYRWQMARIARTESTAAANFGAVQAGRSTGIQMQKLWLSAQDDRTRIEPYNHLFMDGVTADDGALFNVNGDFLEFPGDPNGAAGNVINCRCGISMIPKRDKNGRLIIE